MSGDRVVYSIVLVILLLPVCVCLAESEVMSCSLNVLPQSPAVGENFTVEMTVTLLDPEAGVINVVPTISFVGTGEIALISGPSPDMANFTEYSPNLSFTWTFKAISPGTITFSGFATGYSPVLNEEIRTENCSASITIVEAFPAVEGGVDLFCAGISANRTEVVVSETLRVEANVSVRGEFEELETVVGFFVGPPEEGKIIAAVPVNFTGDLRSRKVWCDLRITQEGEYRIYVFVDYLNEVSEADEGNNICEVEITASGAYPVPTVPPTSPPPQPSQTPVETSPPPSPSLPTEKEGEEGIRRIIITGLIILGSLFGGYFLSELIGGRKCCCLTWNFRKGKLELRTVKPRAGNEFLVPLGGALPLVAKASNVEWLTFNCRSISPSGKVRDEVRVSLPIQDEVIYKWELVEGPGYLISPYQHNHSGVVFGPVVVYQAPELPDDPELVQEVRKQFKDKLVRIKLTVDDLQRKVNALDFHPPEVREFRIRLTDEVRAINADYSDVITEIIPEEIPEVHPPGLIKEELKKQLIDLNGRIRDLEDKIRGARKEIDDLSPEFEGLDEFQKSLLGMSGRKISEEELIEDLRKREKELPKKLQGLLKQYEERKREREELEKERERLEEELRELEEEEREISHEVFSRAIQQYAPIKQLEALSRKEIQRPEEVQELQKLTEELEEVRRRAEFEANLEIERRGIRERKEELNLQLAKIDQQLSEKSQELERLLTTIRNEFLDWVNKKMEELESKIKEKRKSLHDLLNKFHDLLTKRSELLGKYIDEINKKIKNTECGPSIRWDKFSPLACSITGPKPMEVLDRISLKRFSRLYPLTHEGLPRSMSSYISLIKNFEGIDEFPEIKEKVKEILRLEEERSRILDGVLSCPEEVQEMSEGSLIQRLDNITKRQEELRDEIAKLAEARISRIGDLMLKEFIGVERAKVVRATTSEILILQAEGHDPDLLQLRCGHALNGGKPLNIILNDKITYRWSILSPLEGIYYPEYLHRDIERAWMAGEMVERHYRGMFLATNEGSSVIYLTPICQAIVTIKCEASDSGMQAPDGSREDYIVVVVDRPGPIDRLLNAYYALEERIGRLRDLNELIKRKIDECRRKQNIIRREVEEEEEARKIWSTIFNIVGIAIGITSFFVPVVKIANLIMSSISTGTAVGFAIPSLMWTWEDDPSLDLITERIESDVEGVFAKAFVETVQRTMEHYRYSENIDPFEIAEKCERGEDVELPDLKKALSFFDQLADSLEKLKEKIDEYIEELERQKDSIDRKLRRVSRLRSMLSCFDVP